MERMMTVAWLQRRYRNEEVLGAGRLKIEQRLRQVVRCLEEDDAAKKVETSDYE